MVQGQQGVGLHQLGLDQGAPDGDDRLVGEDWGPLRNGPDVAAEPEVPEVLEKPFPKASPAPEVVQVLLGKAEVLEVLDYLLQPRADGKSPRLRHPAEEEVKDHVAVPRPALQVAVGHGKLVKIRQHGKISLLIQLIHILISPSHPKSRLQTPPVPPGAAGI